MTYVPPEASQPAASGPLMPTYPVPAVTFVRGQGTELFDRQGRRYLDLLCGLAVTSLGHAHPAVADAISTQSRTLLHVSNLFASEINLEVAAILDRLITGQSEPTGQIFFCNSGAEANEAAIKVARKFGGRGRHSIVSAFGSFHGRTLATLHATGQPAKWEPFQPLPDGFRHAAWNDLADLERQLDDTVAGVLLEPVQGEGGVHPATQEFFAGVRELCTERGILMMVDEIQTGLARTGKWFGFQHFGVEPDVVTMAKALGNGMPIGACWAKQSVAAVFEPGDHGTTYGGQPLAAAAARAVLNELQAMDAPARAQIAGERFRAGLGGQPGVADIRGFGLLLAIELDGLNGPQVAAAALERGLVLNGVSPTALRIAPPLTITEDEIDEALSILIEILAAQLEAADTNRSDAGTQP